MDDLLGDLVDDPVFWLLAPLSVIFIVCVIYLSTGAGHHHVTPHPTVTVTVDTAQVSR